ncbi:MAG: hypothetical protein HYZ53_10700 [Planctomycetes bacterium]|nr:hypothetical protein [Planctomycetota bacterium]
MTKWFWAVAASLALLAAVPAVRAQEPKEPPAGEGMEGGEEPPAEKTVVPTWEVGDWWKVQYMPLIGNMPKRPTNGPSLTRDPRVKETCTFTVEDLKDLDGNLCYVLKVAAEGDEKTSYRIWIRQANLTVKLFEEVRLVDGQESVTGTKNPVKPFFRLESGTTIPFDFPRFPVEEADETTGDTVQNTSVPMVQKATYAKDKLTVSFESSARVNGKEVKSYQKWEAGKPWWVEAKRTEAGVDAEMGKLVDWSRKE